MWYDTDGDAVRNIDEIGREVDSAWDGRHRVLSRTFPESDQELFTYDLSDNVLSLTQVAKPGSGLANTVVSATYEPTWNHLASITDARNYITNFAYYPSGSGAWGLRGGDMSDRRQALTASIWTSIWTGFLTTKGPVS